MHFNSLAKQRFDQRGGLCKEAGFALCVFAHLFWWNDFCQWCSVANSYPLQVFRCLLWGKSWQRMEGYHSRSGQWSCQHLSHVAMSLSLIQDGLCYCSIYLPLKIYSVLHVTLLRVLLTIGRLCDLSQKSPVVCLYGNSVTKRSLHLRPHQLGHLTFKPSLLFYSENQKLLLQECKYFLFKLIHL